MKLARLEIIGFKSFMERTVLTFDKSITSIVGPNGCGKSNVVDAIRWVMGEQSAKHLRGTSMEDVIFAGTQSRPPLSMASVELTFSTDGYQTPAQYLNHSEISIMRRLYRTGESEYMINKVPVRHKDIIDLFLGTGIGTKAYSVIEQGKIGQIVTAKPEERRFLIEEVAGISKFKARKESALRKMEATQQNLLRLNDILIELERQLKSLDRQAKKAEKYKAIKTQYTQADLQLSSHIYSGLDQNQTRLEGELKEADSRQALLQADLQEKENNIEAQQLILSEKEIHINQAQTQVNRVADRVRHAEANIRIKEEEIKNLRHKITELDHNLVQLDEDLVRTLQTLEHLASDQGEAILQSEEAQGQLTSLQEIVSELGSQLHQAKTNVSSLREQVFENEKRSTKLKVQQGALEQKQTDLTARIANEENELLSVTTQRQELQKIYFKATNELGSLKHLKLDLVNQTGQITTDVGTLKQSLKELEAGLSQLKDHLTQKKSRLHSLQELERNFEGYQDGPRSLLKKKSEWGDEICGTIADIVSTAPEFEGAVSAALGEKIQFVLVKNQEAGVRALDYLRGESLGRSSVVPLSFFESSTDDYNHQNDERILGPLSQFVHFKSNDDQLKNFLFGDVYLVKELSQAIDAWASQPVKKTFVTLGGEVVDARGVITGGSLSSASKALLEKKREIQEILGELETMHQEVFEKEISRRELSQKLNQLEATLAAVVSSSFQEEIKISNQEKDISHFRLDIEKLENKERQLKSKITLEKDSLAAIEPELAQIKTELETLTQSLGDSGAAFESEKLILEEKQAAFDSKNQELTQAKINAASTQSRLANLDRELNNQLQFYKRHQQSKQKKRTDLLLSQLRIETLTHDLAYLKKLLAKRLEQKETLDASFNVLKDEYQVLMTGLRESENNLKGLRKNADQATTQLNQVTLELTRLREQMKNLAEQAMERHQVDLNTQYKTFQAENFNEEETRVIVAELKDQLFKLGEVNTAALEEYEEIKERFEFLKQQKEDLENSLSSLEKVIQKINKTTKDKFYETFKLVDAKFQEVFPRLFRGGRASLVLTDENNMLETGVEIVAQPPGKKLQTINLLSGGEKALTAVSLIFSIFQIKPSPFCLLDEVDAPLDDANVSRYNQMIREMTGRTQFIVITHNKKTMEVADTLYGVTMQERGISNLISVNLS